MVSMDLNLLTSKYPATMLTIDRPVPLQRLQRLCATSGSKRRALVRVYSHPEENAASGGDAFVQEQLVKQLKQVMSKKRLTDTIKQYMEQSEVERLKSKAKDAKEDIERRQKLEMERSNLEFNSLQADVNKAADDFEESLRKSRAEMENSKAEFEAFERMVEKDQNRHLFFQGLYKREEEKKKSKNKKSARTKRIDAFIEARNQRDPVIQSAHVEAQSLLRTWLYAILALNLAVLVVANLLSDDPQYVADGLYAALAGLLGRTAWVERHYMLPGRQK